MERPGGLIEQVDCWPCQTTVTHILCGRILSYLSANIHCTIHVCVHRRPTRLTDVQATLHTISITLPSTARTRLRRVLLALAVNKDTVFFGLVFEQAGEAVELPTVEFLVPTLAPVPRVAVLVFSNIAQVTDGDATDPVVNALLNDVFGKSVQEVIFPPRQLLTGTKGTLRWAVLTFGVVLVVGEVVLVLFQHVPRIQLSVPIVVGDSEVVADTEVDTRRVVTGCVLDRDFDFADEVKFPVVTVPDSSHLLDVLHSHVRSCFVLCEDEV